MSPTGQKMRDRAKAIKKAEIAIDKIIDIKALGFGCDTTERVLELLNALRASLETQ